jgi:hypothetical protein
MKRGRLIADDKKSVALSPEAVVACVKKLVRQTIIQIPEYRCDIVLEPCAGDGRLGRAVLHALQESNIVGGAGKRQECILFDIRPQAKDVKKLDVLSERDMQGLRKSLQGHKCMVVLNPPFNPKDELKRICSASLGLEGATTCVLVLPGVYRDPSLLDKLLPRWWHVEGIEDLDFQKFEQPLLKKTTSDLMLAIVFAVRKSYLRQSAVESDEKVSSQRLFEFVSVNDKWHHAFQTGAIQHPIQIKSPGEKRPYGRWKFVKYLECESPGELERICNLVKVRTAYATEKDTFPVYGTTDRISIAKEAVCDWLNLILSGDSLFFEGLQKQNPRNAFDRNTVGLNDDDNDEIDSDDTIGKQVSQKKRVKMDVVVDAGDVWCIDFQKECSMRAQSNNEASPFDVLRLAGVKQQRAAERFKVTLTGDDYEAMFLAGLKVQACLKGCVGFTRGSKLDFCIRVLMGRALFLLKFSEKLKIPALLLRLKAKVEGNVQFKKELNQKTLERYWNVYKRVKEQKNLRFAWGGHFDKLSKNGGKFKKAVLKYELDFGGPSPLETVETAGGPALAVPCWFLLFETDDL